MRFKEAAGGGGRGSAMLSASGAPALGSFSGSTSPWTPRGEAGCGGGDCGRWGTRRATMMTGRGCAAGAQLTQWHGARGGPQSARVFGILSILEPIWVCGFWSSLDTVRGTAPKWGHQKVTKGCLCTLYQMSPRCRPDVAQMSPRCRPDVASIRRGYKQDL